MFEKVETNNFPGSKIYLEFRKKNYVVFFLQKIIKIVEKKSFKYTVGLFTSLTHIPSY
jgi:hypothetical protein